MRLRLLATLLAFVSVVALTTLRTSAQDPAPAAWANDLAPIAASDWNYARAAHLIERAGFGAPPEEIARLAKLTPEQAVNELVDYQSIRQELQPFDESLIWDPGMDPFPPSRAEAVRIARERGVGLGEPVLPPGTQRRLQPVVDKFFYSLIANGIETQRLGLWWANRMLASKRPLEEKLTLFWHGHFATGQNKVRDYRMMLRQNELFRAQASGRFRDLLVGILKDPGDAGVSRQRREHQEPSQRELRPRAAGAVHDGRRQLLRARRARSRASLHRLDQRCPGVQARHGAARSRHQDVPRQDRRARRRGHRRRDSGAAGHGGVHHREGLPVLGARRHRGPGEDRTGPHLPRERLRPEAAAQAHLPVARLLQPGLGRRRRSRARCSWSCPPIGRWGCARFRPFPTSAA